MSIELKVSNSLESLANHLAEVLKTNNSVFRPDYIVTQTQGMNNWLKNRLADSLGIAANIRFMGPDEAIHRIYRLLGGRYEVSLSVHDLNWLLFEILDEDDFKKEYPQVSAYYSGEGTDAEIKRMSLAEKIADLFDQYQIYRYKMIESWNQNKDFLDSKFEADETWQRDLWHRAVQKAGVEFPDKTKVGSHILEALEDAEMVRRLKENLSEINFFGLSLITEYHLMLLDELSKYIDIRFLIQNPSPDDYWYDEKSEKVLDFLQRKNIISKDIVSTANPLLVNWGKTVQSTFRMLFQKDEMLNVYEDVGLEPPHNDTLLHSIQNAVYNNEKENIVFTKEQIEDGSITINSCYSPVREVEVLYNYLVHLIDVKGEELSAKDIVVMVSDIDLYASYIKAIFDTGPYPFPYTIADESYQNEDNLFSVMAEILSLSQNQFTSENVAGLLGYSAIKKRFGIEDIELTRSLIKNAGIRLGIKGNREDESRYISWEYGLKRIIYGLTMSGGEEYSDGKDDFYPIDMIEGYDTFKAVALVSFVKKLINNLKIRREERSITEWVDYIWETVDDFIGNRDDNDEDDFRELTEQLKRYNVSQRINEEKVSYEVFIHNFLPILSNAKRSSAFAGRGITFCSLIPMRSIPFKVVALLGIDYDKFPRQDRRVSFDLIKKQSKPGDRNIKENDKHLFLENVLSAKDFFYVSYIGQSVKDNSNIPASVLVDELVEFIAKYSYDSDVVRKNFVTLHPFHGFSREYNAGDTDLYSYMIEPEKPEPDFKKDSVNEQIFDFKEISIKDLNDFFKDPIKAYYNKVLNIYYEDEDLSLPEEEVFELDKLQQWSYKNRFIDFDKTEMNPLIEQDKKLGKLPLKNMGTVALDKVYEEMQDVRETFQEITEGMVAESKEIKLKIDSSEITGKVRNIYEDTLVELSFSSWDAKYKFSAYLNYLLLNASGEQVNVSYINKSGALLEIPDYMDRAEAERRLNELVKIFKKGRKEVYHLSMALADKLKGEKSLSELDKMDSVKVKSEIISAIEEDYRPFDDVYLAKEYEKDALEDAELIFSQFREIYENAIEPLTELFIE